MAEELTPMRKQYLTIKKNNKDCLLFFRLGDFYEMFDEDARVASRELDLTLTTRDRGKAKEDQTPMCGVPYHSAEAYIARLVAKGYKVAICEQMQDPATTKGLVERDIVRIVTPGTVTESSMLDESKNNYMACLMENDGRYGLAVCDVSTGAFFATEAKGPDAVARICAELGRFSPREVLRFGEGTHCEEIELTLMQRLSCCVDEGDKSQFRLHPCQDLLKEHFSQSLEDIGIVSHVCATLASGALLARVLEVQKSDCSHINTLQFYTSGRFMELDITARRNLELTETLRGKEKKGSLLWVLDKTGCPMGSRMLRSWMEKPLLDPIEIDRRLSAVEELLSDPMGRGAVVEVIKTISDLERVMARIVTGSAGGRDLVSLAQGCRSLPQLKAELSKFRSPMLKKLTADIDTLEDCVNLVDSTIVDEPPFTIREGGLIREGADPEIDRLRSIMDGGTGAMASIEASERQNTGIAKLKVGYNRVFGYYIEISKAYTGPIPAHYIRKQTLANCERYITPELKELENTILTAKERVTAMEYDLFCKTREFLGKQSARVQQTANAVAAADVLCSLATVAAQNHYCRPEIISGQEITIQEGRHPVVERMLTDSLFVPNDTQLGVDSQVAIITGPNMAGKSTYMRQVALIVIMAQMGSFVPARAARLGVVDRVFTRIGASDDLAAGQSTFMVEMSEVAQILKYATSRSLLILDEIGRGTSTYDGMAIARAVLEYVADPKTLGAKTLFATHYHELTSLEEQLPKVRNYNIAVKKRGQDMIFLRRIVPGAADQSYGVEVARMAGLPNSVVSRARKLLQELEAGKVEEKPMEPLPQADQLTMLDIVARTILSQLENVAPEAMTPIEAMNFLYKLKRMSEHEH